MKRGPYKFDPAARAAALRVFAATGNAAAATRAAGVSSSTLRRTLTMDDEFREQWEEARETFVAVLEAEAHRRAVDGVEETKFGPFGPYTVVKYDSSLLLALLRANAPEKYGATMKVEQETHVTGGLDIANLSPASRAKLREILESESKAG